METPNLLILGAVGAAAWFFFFRRQTPAAPITDTNPGAAASMTPGAAEQTQVSRTSFLRGLTASEPFGPRPTGSLLGSTAMSGSRFVAQALLLTAKDNTPVPTPPAAGNAFFPPILGTRPVLGTGSGSTGPNPTLSSIRTNPYTVLGTRLG